MLKRKSLVVLLILTLSSFKFAQAITVDPAKGVIDDAENASQRLIIQAQQSGNGLVSNAASQLSVLAQTTALILGNDINKSMNQLSQTEQAAVNELKAAIIAANATVGKVYDIEDTTAIDLTRFESGIPFTHTPDFYVKRISNTGMLPQPGNYHVVVTAYGLGIANDTKADITGTLDGKPLIFREVDQTTAGKAILEIPNQVLAPYFSSTKLAVVKMELTVVVSRKGLFGWKGHSYPVPVYLTLYPPQVATIALRITKPVYDWVDVGAVSSAPMNTPEKDGCTDNGCRANNSLDLRVVGPTSGLPIVGAQRLKEVHLQCNSGFERCRGWWGNQTLLISDNGTKGTATWLSWTHPQNFTLIGSVQEYRQVGTQQEDHTYALKIDQPQVVPLPPEYSLLALTVSGYSGRQYTVILPQVDPHHIVDAALQGNSYVFSAVVPVPQYN